MLAPTAVRVVLSVILMIQMLDLCESLQEGEEGVCLEHYVGIESGYLTAKERLVCCDKYKYSPELDQCRLMCKFSCVNGTCVDAYTCICAPPHTLVNDTCVLPTSARCGRGGCDVADIEISCDKGYRKWKSNGTCEPICDYSCVNGKCIEPNKCECNPGYKVHPNNTFYCIPIPDTDDVVRPSDHHNKSLCNERYESTGNSSDCKPICVGCDHGQCVAPYNCTCSEGYERINSTCKPKCSSCKNGDCVLPGECRCHEGYSVTEEGCKPICSPPCSNGHCWAPNRCSCNEGYYLQCSITCINEYCSAHNNCTCVASYEKIEESYCHGFHHKHRDNKIMVNITTIEPYTRPERYYYRTTLPYEYRKELTSSSPSPTYYTGTERYYERTTPTYNYRKELPSSSPSPTYYTGTDRYYERTSPTYNYRKELPSSSPSPTYYTGTERYYERTTPTYNYRKELPSSSPSPTYYTGTDRYYERTTPTYNYRKELPSSSPSPTYYTGTERYYERTTPTYNYRKELPSSSPFPTAYNATKRSWWYMDYSSY